MVQNKVGEKEARRMLAELKGTFNERTGKAEGFTLWRCEESGEWMQLKGFSCNSYTNPVSKH